MISSFQVTVWVAAILRQARRRLQTLADEVEKAGNKEEKTRQF
jgi:hypothetical protein